MTAYRVMCVDDEPHVLGGLERNLRKLCPTVTAVGGEAALAILRKERDFAVIISDMRMPGMDGAQFLVQARLLVPDAVRILLTGEADLDAVISAVNQGHIQHYLRKPVEKADLHRLVERSFVDYEEHLAARERVVSSTRAATRFAMELLRARNPLVASHAERAASVAVQLGEQLGFQSLPSLEVAARVWALCRNQQTGNLFASVEAMLSPHEEFDAARQALDELRAGRTEGISAITRVVTAACLIDELDQGANSADEVLALLERLVDQRVLDAARSLNLLNAPKAA